VRFAATLDFSLDPATQQAATELAADIRVVSAERIAAEIERMLVDPHRVRALELLRETGLLVIVMPEAAPLVEDARRWNATLAVLERLEDPSFGLALAALLRGVLSTAPVGDASEQPRRRRGGPTSPVEQLVDAVVTRWKLSNATSDRTRWLMENYATLAQARQLPWSRLQPLLTHEFAGELVGLSAAVLSAVDGDATQTEYCRQKLALPADQLDPPALLNGGDLNRRAIPAGPAYRRLLQAVRDAQLDGAVTTKAEALELVDRLTDADTNNECNNAR
ncbi:MAG: hypothetical protein KDA63_07995, partial [Planctomycetales bacterium]|nr:hypothetical protein [Planctomycetales bacterium]